MSSGNSMNFKFIQLHFQLGWFDFQEINKKLTSMKVPFAVLHAENDKLCNVQGSKVLFEKAQVKDKHLKVFPVGCHHLYRETQIIRQEALNDTVSWICQRVPIRT